MTIFTFFTIIYYIFFAAILLLALNVYFRLRSLSKQISLLEIEKTSLNLDFYKSSESFLLYSSPRFPLFALVKILPGTFVGFGILGTFLGFSNGISGMSLTSNVDELFGKLDVFFSGLNTAFATSIIGVVLSVLFGTILYQWPLNTIKFHCARIYNELSKTQTPAEATKNEFDVYIGSLQEMTKTLLTARESIETLPEKFLAVGKSLEESVAPVKETFGAMQETLENYSKQATALQNASEQIQASLTKFIETSEQTTEKVNQNLSATITATKDIQENSAKMNEQILESQKAALKDYQEIDEKIASILETVNKNLGEYSATIEKTLVSTLEEYNKTAQKVTESFFGEKK